MDGVIALALAWLTAFVINLVPAFMPPTWSVLAVFKVTTDAPLLPLTVGGAAASAAGRTLLALSSRKLRGFLPKKDQENAEALGGFIRRHGAWGTAIVFFGCLGPLPSNALFIAAGLGRVRLLPVVVAFWISRSIADTFWVWSADAIAEGAGSVFRDQVTSWQGIAVQVLGLLLVVGVFRLPWAKWLGLPADGQADSSKTQHAAAGNREQGNPHSSTV